MAVAETAAAGGWLSTAFNTVVVGGIGIIIGGLMTEPITLALGHFNSGGVELMNAINPWLQSFFDNTGITDGLSSLAKMIPAPDPTNMTTNSIPPGNSLSSAMDRLDF